MTIAATVTSVQYFRNGVTLQWSYPNKIFAAADLTVIDLDTSVPPVVTPLVLGTDYTVQNVDVDAGCMITTTVPGINGHKLDIRTNIAELQTTSIKNQGSFLPELHEEAFDKLTRMLQDLFRKTYTFGIHGPDIESTPWSAIPNAVQRAGSYLAFDLNGGPIVATSPPATGFTSAGGWASPFNFGCVGDGVTDDTVGFQAALTAATGGILYLPSNIPSGAATAKFLIGNVTVPRNTSILGALPYPTLLSTSTGGLQVNPYNLGSQIRTKAGATITANDGCAFKDLLIIHAGLSLPATTNAQAATLLGQFADIAITAPQASVRLEQLMILGYSRATFITNSGGVNQSSRTIIRDIMGDNINGIYVSDSADVSHFSGCHMFPFLTFGISGVTDANLQRSGAAYYFQNVDDWFTVFDCFSFGYFNAYEGVDTSAVAFLRCQADYTATGGGGHAFLMTHSVSHSEYISIMQCQAIGYLNPCLLDPGPGAPAGNDTIQFIGNKLIIAAGGIGLECPSGYLMAMDNLLQGHTIGVQLDAGCTGACIENNRFTGVTNAIVNNTTAPVVIRDNPGYNPVGVSQATHLVAASPYTYTAGPSPETLYAFANQITQLNIGIGGGISVLPGATALMVPIELGPNEQAVFTYTNTLTITTYKH